jgi:hypothetical protein
MAAAGAGGRALPAIPEEEYRVGRIYNVTIEDKDGEVKHQNMKIRSIEVEGDNTLYWFLKPKPTQPILVNQQSINSGKVKMEDKTPPENIFTPKPTILINPPDEVLQKNQNVLKHVEQAYRNVSGVPPTLNTFGRHLNNLKQPEGFKPQGGKGHKKTRAKRKNRKTKRRSSRR